MPNIGIGIGIDRDAIIRLMKDLCIKPDRIDALHEVLTQATENGTGNPSDDIQRFIAFSTKANELAFLCFMTGLAVGSHAVISQVQGQMGNVIEKAVIMGAEHSEEIKEAIGNMTSPTDQPAPATAAKKKDGKPEDIMYG